MKESICSEAIFAHEILSTADGAIDLFAFGDPAAKNRYLITGGKHGGEIESVDVSWRFVEMLKVASNEYSDVFFVVVPELSPAQSRQAMDDISNNCVKGKIADFRNKYRVNLAGINLNRDYPTNGDSGPFLLAEQTRIILDLHEKYGFNMMFDFHSHMRTPFTHYVCDNPDSVVIARRLNNINGNGWLTYCYRPEERLAGCAGEYFGVEREVGFITVELGACPRKRDFKKHCDLMWGEQFSALDWLFRQNLSDFH